MLIDLGYEKHKEPDICENVFYNSSENSVIRFECDTESIDLERNGVTLSLKEIQAIHQIMIDYGWNKDESEEREWLNFIK